MEYIQELLTVKYFLIESILENDELKAEKTYGIQVSNEDGENLLKREDICLDLEHIEKFICDLNVHGASIHHLDELIENFLGE